MSSGSSSFFHFHHTDTHFLSLRLSWSCFCCNLLVFSLFLLKSCLLVGSWPSSFKSSLFSFLLPTTRALYPVKQERVESEAVLWSRPQEMGQLHWSCKLYCRILLSPGTRYSSQRTEGSRRVHQKQLTGGWFTGHPTVSLWVVNWIPDRPVILASLLCAPFRSYRSQRVSSSPFCLFLLVTSYSPGKDLFELLVNSTLLRINRFTTLDWYCHMCA